MPRIFGLNGLWAGYPVADALALLLTAIWTGIEFRRLGIPFRLQSKHKGLQGVTVDKP